MLSSLSVKRKMRYLKSQPVIWPWEIVSLKSLRKERLWESSNIIKLATLMRVFQWDSMMINTVSQLRHEQSRELLASNVLTLYAPVTPTCSESPLKRQTPLFCPLPQSPFLPIQMVSLANETPRYSTIHSLRKKWVLRFRSPSITDLQVWPRAAPILPTLLRI